jgi:hypothetical protein
MPLVPSSTDSLPLPPDGLPPVVGNASQDLQSQKLASLRQQLAQTQEELASLQALMDSLPEIFEQKFQERVAPMLQQRQRLLDHNTALRSNLHQLAPAAGSMDGVSGRGARPRLGAALRHAFGLEERRTTA